MQPTSSTPAKLHTNIKGTELVSLTRTLTIYISSRLVVMLVVERGFYKLQGVYNFMTRIMKIYSNHDATLYCCGNELNKHMVSLICVHRFGWKSC